MDVSASCDDVAALCDGFMGCIGWLHEMVLSHSCFGMVASCFVAIYISVFVNIKMVIITMRG